MFGRTAKWCLGIALVLGALVAFSCEGARACDGYGATTFSFVQPQVYAQEVYAQPFVQREVVYAQPFVQRQVIVQRNRVYAQPFVRREVVRQRVVVPRARVNVRVGY